MTPGRDERGVPAAPLVRVRERPAHYMIQPLVELHGGCMVVLTVS
jgi:hypothetical protein